MSATGPVPMSEGDLLHTLLLGLTQEQAFQLGEVVAIMRRSDVQYIAQLKRQVEDLKRVIEQHQIANEEADGGGPKS